MENIYINIMYLFGVHCSDTLYYILADHNDWRLSFNVSYDGHKFKDLQNCVRMICNKITCWFYYVNRSFLFSTLDKNKKIEIFVYQCVSFKFKGFI